MAAKVLSVATALGLLIGSSTIGFAQNSITDQAPGPKVPEKALMDPKAGVSNDAPGRLVQENGAGGASFAPAQGTAGPADTASPGPHQ
jgi:hypothetical protein